jgi:hypothetical protein
MNIQPAYVTFEQAKLLKEKGFDLDVTSEITSSGFVNTHGIKANWNETNMFVSAPEQPQVIEWLRLTKGYFVTVILDRNADYKFTVQMTDGEFVKVMAFPSATPHTAYSAAIDYILNELI